MKESKSDLWTQFGVAHHRIAISTNGFVKKNGEAVMGRGCALQATKRFPEVALLLGNYIRVHGNVPGYLYIGRVDKPQSLMILPVKRNWWEDALPELVKTSIGFVKEGARQCPEWTFHIPRLGCGNGRLDWNVVREWHVDVPDNVIVHGG